MRYSPWSDDVGTHTAGSLLNSNDLVESVDTSLGGGDVGLVRCTLVVEGGRNVEVRSLGLANGWEGGLESVVCAELGLVGKLNSAHSVNLDDCAECVLGETGDGSEEVASGACESVVN